MTEMTENRKRQSRRRDNMNIGYCNAWPDNLKDAWEVVDRLDKKIRCLDANIERISYSEFDTLYSELQKVRADLNEACRRFETLYRQYDPGHLSKDPVQVEPGSCTNTPLR